MTHYYTDEKNAQLVLSALKAMQIRKVIVSPGTTNIPFVQGVQYDDFFEVFSSVDERSAAYLACGLSQETGEPVALSCTGATASRNYLSGLTEAHYKKLPIIAITSTNGDENINNLIAQNIDRSSLPKDTVKKSVSLPVIKDDKDFWHCKNLINKAMITLKKDGGGPIHINLPTSYKGTFETKNLPKINFAKSIADADEIPLIKESSKIVVFIGSHKEFSPKESEILENFCRTYDAVVLCDHTSGFYGYGKIVGAIATMNASREHCISESIQPELIIHIGEVSGDYETTSFLQNSNAKVWRVSNDGELKDLFKKIEYVFDCDEQIFFKKLVQNKKNGNVKSEYFELWKTYIEKLRFTIPNLPFSNISIAKKLSSSLPKFSVIHFGILNSLRSNNFFDYDSTIRTNSNVGGFGIDGCLSTLVGASLSNPEKLYFLVIGDLAFFYDMNVLGNRHIGKNIRIILINNGGGGEFKNYSHMGATLGDLADDYVAAANHWIGKTTSPARAWVESLGFDYLSAINDEEFESKLDYFYKKSEKPMVLECFTNFQDDSDSLKIISNLDKNLTLNGKVKQKVRDNLSNDVKNMIKKIVRK